MAYSLPADLQLFLAASPNVTLIAVVFLLLLHVILPEPPARAATGAVAVLYSVLSAVGTVQLVMVTFPAAEAVPDTFVQGILFGVAAPAGTELRV